MELAPGGPAVPEPAVTRRGRQAAETDCGQPAPAQPVAGAMAAQSSPGTSASNAILWVSCLWRSGRPRQALFFAPLFGIEHLTEFDTREHPLATLLGRSYQSSTLTQFLGQLERVRAAEALVPTLVPAQAGQITSIDGHMIAYWSRVAMHKGKITMR